MTNIDIKGTIISSEDQWIYDFFGIQATSPKAIQKALLDANGDDVTFVINSGGGDVFAGNEINYMISQYQGNTISDIVGIAASIATVVACASDKVRMAAGAQYMIHNVSSSQSGDYRDMNHMSEVLISANRSIANTYRLKTGMTEKELFKLMDHETWMDAARAVELHFADEIIGDTEGQLTDAGKVALYNNNQFATILSDDVKNKLREQYKNQGSSFDCYRLQAKINLERMRGKQL